MKSYILTTMSVHFDIHYQKVVAPWPTLNTTKRLFFAGCSTNTINFQCLYLCRKTFTILLHDTKNWWAKRPPCISEMPLRGEIRECYKTCVSANVMLCRCSRFRLLFHMINLTCAITNNSRFHFAHIITIMNSE